MIELALPSLRALAVLALFAGVPAAFAGEASVPAAPSGSPKGAAELPRRFPATNDSDALLGNGARPPAGEMGLDELANEPLGDDLDQPDLSLAAAPPMFGDFGGGGFRFSEVLMGHMVSESFRGEIALAGGCRRTKVAENNLALAQDRIYVSYNHFANAWNVTGSGQSVVGALNRYTVGAEKSFFEDRWSVELRMPVSSGTDTQLTFDGVRAESGQLGNLAAILKWVVYQTDASSYAVGLGLDLPTGSDAQVDFFGSTLLHNDAVHLSPYVAMLIAPDESRHFFHGFLQLDVPLNGNRISRRHWDGSVTAAGTLLEDPLLHLDLGLGRWLVRNPVGVWITGVAALVELHYTAPLGSGHSVAGEEDFPWLFDYAYSSEAKHLVHLTFGSHVELRNRTQVRVAGVVPLQPGRRDFDAELAASVIRRF